MSIEISVSDLRRNLRLIIGCSEEGTQHLHSIREYSPPHEILRKIQFACMQLLTKQFQNIISDVRL